MKTIKDIQQEIEDLHTIINGLKESKYKKDVALVKNRISRIRELRKYIFYLETNPSEEYLQKEYLKIQNRINDIKKRRPVIENPERFTRSQLTAMKKEFEKYWKLPKMRQQLDVINYILK